MHYTLQIMGRNRVGDYDCADHRLMCENSVVQNYSGNHIAHVHQYKVHGVVESEGSLNSLLVHMNNTNAPLRETEHIAKSVPDEQAHLQQEVCAKRLSRTSVWCIDGVRLGRK